jgi:HlyD family secretion protein
LPPGIASGPERGRINDAAIPPASPLCKPLRLCYDAAGTSYGLLPRTPVEQLTAETGKNMRKRLLATGAVIVVAATLIGGAVVWLRSHDRKTSLLMFSGTVEVTEVNVGFKLPGVVTELQAAEGQRVRTGDRIAVLDNVEIRNVVAQHRAAVRLAEAELEKARKDLERYQALAGEGAVTTQQLDSAQRAHDVARAQVDQSGAALRAAEARLKDTVLEAPLTGVVLARNVERGETVAAGIAVYSLGDLEHPWVKIYVNETKLGMIRLGQTAQVFTDTYPGKVYEGRITYIASEAEFTPKNVQTQEERVKLVFAVKVSVQNVGEELKPGMPADVNIPLQ